jgi:soluble lytic murein transglycosylase-like protein
VKIVFVAVCLLFMALVCSAAQAATFPVTAQCVIAAARLQNIPPQIILGFLKTEGGRLGMESLNRNGSYDLGPMQINSSTWVPKLAEMHFSGDRRAAWIALRDYGCYNINIGAWIFRQYLDEAHGNYADAVGFYNSHNEGPKRAYEERFAANFSRLFGLGGH